MGLTKPRAYQIYDIDYKQSVRVLSTTNVTLAGGAPSQVDGVNLSLNDRVLVKGQTAGAENGIYIVANLGTGANGTWARTQDANQTGEIESGMIIMVTEGMVWADTSWKLITNDPITIGVTALDFEQNTGVAFGNIVANGTPVTSNSASGMFTLAAGNNVNITGNNTSKTITISASGGGGSGTAIINGTSNVDIASANANVTVSVAGTSNVAVFSTSGLAVTGNITGNGIPTTTVSNTAPSNPEQGDIWIVGNTGVQLIYFTSGGNSQWAEMEAATSIEIASYGNANVVANLAALGSNPITTTGNITAGYFIGNGSQLTGLPASYGNANVVTLLSSFGSNTIITTGNITGGNLSGTNVTGTLTTASQPNITSVGTLGSLTVTGNVSTGNVSGTTGTFTNIAGTLTTAAQTNITSVGTLGSLTVTGNVTSGNVSVSGLVKFGDNTTQTTAGISSARSVALNMILG